MFLRKTNNDEKVSSLAEVIILTHRQTNSGQNITPPSCGGSGEVNTDLDVERDGDFRVSVNDLGQDDRSGRTSQQALVGAMLYRIERLRR